MKNKSYVIYIKRLLFIILLLQMFIIVFSFINSEGRQQIFRQQAGTELMYGGVTADPLTGAHSNNDSESDSNQDLAHENSEIGLFSPQPAIMFPIECSFQPNLHASVPGFKNHITDINPRPPRTV